MIVMPSYGDDQPIGQQFPLHQLGNGIHQSSLNDCKKRAAHCVSGDNRSTTIECNMKNSGDSSNKKRYCKLDCHKKNSEDDSNKKAVVILSAT
eukprot:9973171-Ditylum_brightwellii.AAC.1